MNTNLSSDDVPGLLREFPSVIRLPVQWGDQDAFGHVNNTVPIRWLESSRIAYLQMGDLMGLMENTGVGTILASIKCDYTHQLHFPDTVLIGAKVSRLGRASMTMEHAIYTLRHQCIAATGVGIVVSFNYDENRPTRIPKKIRAAIAEMEGEQLSAD